MFSFFSEINSSPLPDILKPFPYSKEILFFFISILFVKLGKISLNILLFVSYSALSISIFDLRLKFLNFNFLSISNEKLLSEDKIRFLKFIFLI